MIVSNVLAQFWRRYQSKDGVSWLSLFTPLFWFLSIFVRWLTIRARSAANDKRMRVRSDSIPVVSIGNLAVGGTGKTPLTIALAKECAARGKRIGIASSGYGRSSQQTITGDGKEFSSRNSDEIGDEMLLIAAELSDAMFAVAKRKADAVESLKQGKKCDLILVDDGFQHWGLSRDVDIVTLNTQMKDRDWRIFPLGILRESVNALSDADIIVWTKVTPVTDLQSDRKRIQEAVAKNIPEFQLEYRLTVSDPAGSHRPLSDLHSRRILLFAGIGDFGSLIAQLERESVPLAGRIEFADHQQYDDAAYRHIHDKAIQVKADLLLTTRKDMVKLERGRLPQECYTLELELHSTPPVSAMTDLIESLIRTRRERVTHS